MKCGPFEALLLVGREKSSDAAEGVKFLADGARTLFGAFHGVLRFLQFFARLFEELCKLCKVCAEGVEHDAKFSRAFLDSRGAEPCLERREKRAEIGGADGKDAARAQPVHESVRADDFGIESFAGQIHDGKVGGDGGKDVFFCDGIGLQFDGAFEVSASALLVFLVAPFGGRDKPFKLLPFISPTLSYIFSRRSVMRAKESESFPSMDVVSFSSTVLRMRSKFCALTSTTYLMSSVSLF